MKKSVLAIAATSSLLSGYTLAEGLEDRLAGTQIIALSEHDMNSVEARSIAGNLWLFLSGELQQVDGATANTAWWAVWNNSSDPAIGTSITNSSVAATISIHSADQGVFDHLNQSLDQMLFPLGSAASPVSP